MQEIIQQILDDPQVPIYGDSMNEFAKEVAAATWLETRDYLVRTALHLNKLGVEKSTVLRLLQPWTK